MRAEPPQRRSSFFFSLSLSSLFGVSAPVGVFVAPPIVRPVVGSGVGAGVGSAAGAGAASGAGAAGGAGSGSACFAFELSSGAGSLAATSVFGVTFFAFFPLAGGGAASAVVVTQRPTTNADRQDKRFISGLR